MPADRPIRFGLNLAPFGELADPHALAALAQVAEHAGWDGFFVWDHMIFDPSFFPIADPWVALAAVALRTERLRLGTLITPLARRRPWKVARETVTLDRLSNGRLILGVGLGEPPQWEFGWFGEAEAPRTRADKLDEALDVLTGLWGGDAFAYDGQHYQVHEMIFQPRPLQTPRIPLWVGGFWPRKRPMRRAARWDGVHPIKEDGPLTPDDWRALLVYIRQHRPDTDAPFEAVGGGVTPPDNPAQAAAIVEPYRDAGVTWWIEDTSPFVYGMDWETPGWPDKALPLIRARIEAGPPPV